MYRFILRYAKMRYVLLSVCVGENCAKTDAARDCANCKFCGMNLRIAWLKSVCLLVGGCVSYTLTY
jgi:hypothetical protein